MLLWFLVAGAQIIYVETNALWILLETWFLQVRSCLCYFNILCLLGEKQATVQLKQLPNMFLICLAVTW